MTDFDKKIKKLEAQIIKADTIARNCEQQVEKLKFEKYFAEQIKEVEKMFPGYEPSNIATSIAGDHVAFSLPEEKLFFTIERDHRGQCTIGIEALDYVIRGTGASVQEAKNNFKFNLERAIDRTKERLAALEELNQKHPKQQSKYPCQVCGMNTHDWCPPGATNSPL